MAISKALTDFAKWGGLRSLARVIKLFRSSAASDSNSLLRLAQTKGGWEIACRMYRDLAPNVSFRDFYWAWRSLFGGLFAVLAHPLPDAGVFHAVSTGFAGLLAARAVIETGRPALLTEHGIYTNERLIELIMADWISDDIELSLSMEDERVSLRSFWIECFESYARTCYEASAAIVSLFPENQIFQRELGADASKMRIIPNGVRWQDFAHLSAANNKAPPTVALIGRVVPFKDLKTFLFAIQLARKEIRGLKAFVIGDLDEDPGYSKECRELAFSLQLSDCIEFTGTAGILEALPRLHVAVLTSLTESQPLVILEAGAAGVPCIATDVGACRELLLGRPERLEDDNPGGIVVPAFAANAIAHAIVQLLDDSALRHRCGDTLRRRVRRYYDRNCVQEAYAALYKEYRGAANELNRSVES